MRLITIFAVLLSFMQAARANEVELDVSVESGGFMGYWRFADGSNGNTIGNYYCNPEDGLATQAYNVRGVDWFHGNCATILFPESHPPQKKPLSRFRLCTL